MNGLGGSKHEGGSWDGFMCKYAERELLMVESADGRGCGKPPDRGLGLGSGKGR